MQITITGKHIHLGDNMQAYAENSIAGVVDKYFGSAVSSDILFSREGDAIKAEIIVHPSSGALLKGTAKAADAYVALDQAVARIGRQLSRYKNRLTDHQADKFEMVPMSIIESDEEEEEVQGTSPVIIAEMETQLPTCSVSDAVMQLDLMEAPALLFRNSAHGQLNMVYRRPDGNIGWVAPKNS
ncbi:MAG: ribosome-associated translation inhibitor RaiA [Alphaproteobacteria bacterium]|nr:ribosome-associated translation inhibitor RaiA [Alphaproteobacteria bacterium]